MANIKFGYGLAGEVVMVLYSQIEEKPTETALTFSAKDARMIAEELIKTAEVSEKIKGKQNGDRAEPN